MNKNLLEEMSVGVDEVFVFMMDVAYLTFNNTIDVLNWNQVPLPLDLLDDAWPTEQYPANGTEIDV